MEDTSLLPNFNKAKSKAKLFTGHNIIIGSIFAIFFVYALTLIFPFLWMFFNSFRTSKEFFSNVWGFPKSFSLFNYYEAAFKFEQKTQLGYFNLLSMFGVSVILTVFGTIANVISSAVSAYVVAKYKFFGRNFLFSLCIFTMIVPIVGTMPAQFRLMTALGLTNNMLGMIIVYSGSFSFNFFMLYGFFKNISWSYAEAAHVDGAGHGTIFFRIMVPLALPALIAVAVIYSIGVWNDFTAPSLYMRDIPTLAVGLQYLVTTLTSRGNYTQMFAAMLIALVPILAIFIAFQKTIMQNTIAGGLKG